MRSAKLCSAVLLVVCFAYVFYMLSVPCMPVVDPSGELVGISRLEYWLLHVSDPSTILWRWTGGHRAILFWDRIPVFALALLWIVASYFVGMRMLQVDSYFPNVTCVRHAMAVILGHASLGVGSWLYQLVMGCNSPLGLMVLCSALYVISFKWKRRAGDCADPNFSNQSDVSFDNTIRRRLVGLMLVACAWLASVQMYGASIPTADQDVRSTEWTFVKHSSALGRLAFGGLPFEQLPSFAATPSLFFASLDHISGAVPLHNSNGIDHRKSLTEWHYQCVVGGKIVHAVLCLLGMCIVGIIASKLWGVLPGIAASFMLLSTPGIAELVRLDRPEPIMGVWGIVVLVIRQYQNEACSLRRSLSWWCIFFAISLSGFWTVTLVGIPSIIFVLADGERWPLWLKNYGRLLMYSGLLGIIVVGCIDVGIYAARHTTRIIYDSNAHGLLLVPLSLAGLIIFATRQDQTVGSRHLKNVLCWIGYWMTIWFFASLGGDCEWVGMLFFLSWFGASCVYFFMLHVHSFWLAMLFCAAMLWNVIVIPIWPTSDNRMLVPWNTFRDEGRSSAEYALNSMLEHGLTEQSQVLMLGSDDDFGILVNCVTESASKDLIRRVFLEVLNENSEKMLKDRGITHVFIDWEGPRFASAPPETKTKVRSRINELIQKGKLHLLSWVKEFPDGEIFQVMN